MRRTMKNAILLLLLLTLSVSTIFLAYLHFFAPDDGNPAGEWTADLDMTEQATVTAFGWLQDIEAVSHLSLRIKEKETVAIVGSNGAGKSTFARLLLGIYRPGKGAALIDGVDTREFLPGDSAGKCSEVFQRFQKYKMTVSDNVFLSNTGAPLDEKGVEQSLAKTGTHQELMDRKGLYFQMYQAQAKWYV